MIGLVIRAVTGVMLPGAGMVTMLFGSLLACCAVCGIYKCAHLRMRDCGCIKRCMRASGADTFDDFEATILVHEALYTSNTMKLSTKVRILAGAHMVETDASNKGIFQQPLSIFIEQGTESVNVELVDAYGRKVLAQLKLDPVKDVLKAKQDEEITYTLKQKNKGIMNPRIKLTMMHRNNTDDEEQGLLTNIHMSTEADLMLRKQLHHVAETEQDEHQICETEVDVLARGCFGPLSMFGSWGSMEPVYVAVRGPPDYRRYKLCIYKDEKECHAFHKPKEEIDLLKILSVQPDPGRADVFCIYYVHSDSAVKNKITFRRLDRARDVWVEMLQLEIRMVHEAKDKERRQGHVHGHGPAMGKTMSIGRTASMGRTASSGRSGSTK